MDYANRRRLKIWGTAKIVHERDQPQLIAQLEMGSYRARVERAVVITVEAIEWNCPQHITPRFTEKEVQAYMAELVEQNRQLNDDLKKATAQHTETISTKPISLGNGDLELVITGIRQLTPRVRAFEFRRPDGGDLPKVTAGSHLRVPVILADGTSETRQYSICSNPSRRDIYEIAVLREENGRGGSIAVHQLYEIGMHLQCDLPRNNFALHLNVTSAILIAGGIGITPIKAMAQELKAKDQSVHLHYAGRSLKQMAYSDRLKRELGSAMHIYPSDQGLRLDLSSVLSDAAPDTEFYVCGPTTLIDAVVETAQELGIAANRVHFERFAAIISDQDQEIRVELRRSKKTIMVRADETVLHAARAAGVEVYAECEAGNCGTCSVKVLEGTPDHRDSVLSNEEHKHSMCICVSRAKSQKLVLDI